MTFPTQFLDTSTVYLLVISCNSDWSLLA